MKILDLWSLLVNRLGSVRQWHWISSAICLIGMFGFAVTGITLNHAGQIEGRPQISSVELVMPAAMLSRYGQAITDGSELPPVIQRWLRDQIGVRLASKSVELSGEEVYIGLPRPGGDAWLTLDIVSGEVFYERTDRGWISWFNDLHKGRYTGSVWSWFLDAFAVACVVFCLTGLWLLWRHAAARPSTWPLVALGLLLPWLIILLFIH